MIAMWHNVFNLPKQIGLWSCWGDHPYNKANGGPVAKYHDLFSSPEAMKLQEARIRFFVDNWGESDHIFAWELANEFNRDNNRWIEHMAAYLKNYELSKYGKSHLRGVFHRGVRIHRITNITVDRRRIGCGVDPPWFAAGCSAACPVGSASRHTPSPGENQDGRGFMVWASGCRMASARLVLTLDSESWSDERLAKVSDKGAGLERLKTTDRSISR
jgi:hypothetical protein